MSKGFFLYFGLLGLVWALPYCDMSDIGLLGCFSYLLDPQHTGQVSRNQLGARLAVLNRTYGLTVDGIFSRCDIDGDGFLTVQDWYSPNRTRCLTDYNSKLLACFGGCAGNGYQQVLQKPPVKRSEPKKEHT